MAARGLSRTRAILACAALASLAAACGSDGAATSGPRVTASARHRAPDVPVKVQAYARQLLARLRPPAGSSRAVLPPQRVQRLKPMVPVQLKDAIDLHLQYQVRASAGSVQQYLARHVPPGMRPDGNGEAGQSGITQASYASYVPDKLPPGIAAAELATTVAPAPAGSLLRVDAQVTWYPPRSPAEEIRAARYREVTVTVPPPLGGLTHPATRTFTSRKVVMRLAALLNGLPAMPPYTGSCPAVAPSSLLLTPRAGHTAKIIVTLTGCSGDAVRVGGQAQPALDERDNNVLTPVLRLLGLRIR
jgi:hypothetical protein